eukprot:Gb_04157 [translate_table: standard]
MDAQSSFNIGGRETEWASYTIQYSSRSLPMFGKNSMDDIPPWLKKPSLFYILHLTYFVALGFIGAFILWVCPSKNSEYMSFVDALYCSISALTVTGLICVRIESLHVFPQVVLLLLTVLGSQIFTSLLPLYARRLAYKKILINQAKAILSQQEYGTENFAVGEIPRELHEEFSVNEATVNISTSSGALEGSHESKIAVTEIDQQQTGAKAKEIKARVLKHKLKEAIADCMQIFNFMWKRGVGHVDCISVLSQQVLRSSHEEGMEISAWKTQFLEYEALTYLNRIVVAYFVLVQIGGIILIQLYLCIDSEAVQILRKSSINQTYFSVYNSLTSFGNAGFTLLDSSMIPFRGHAFILATLSIVILLGNTMFAPCLRMIISLLHRSGSGAKRQIYAYLLEHPRKCYTHLFPRNQTLWLIVTVMGFNTTQCLFFCVLDWNSSSLKGLGPARKIVDAMFQSAATRNAGSNVVNLADLSPPMLVLFVGMMYIAVYPVYLTRQKTRAPAAEMVQCDYYEDSKISVQSRKLLARDSAHLFIIVFIICIVEGDNIVHDPLNYSIFNIIFEVTSAFGNVGLSVGYSCSLGNTAGEASQACEDVPYSLSGKWSTGGKILILITMFLGRHRGLPDSIDSALLLPRSSNNEDDESNSKLMPARTKFSESATTLRLMLDSFDPSQLQSTLTSFAVSIPDHYVQMQTAHNDATPPPLPPRGDELSSTD